MGHSGCAWVLALWRRRPIDRLVSREVARERYDTRSLIRIANEVDHTPSFASKISQRPTPYSLHLLRCLTVAEERLATSIAGAPSRSLTVGDLEQDVIRPFFHSMVVVSELAHQVIRHAVRAAAQGANASS